MDEVSLGDDKENLVCADTELREHTEVRLELLMEALAESFHLHNTHIGGISQKAD